MEANATLGGVACNATLGLKCNLNFGSGPMNDVSSKNVASHQQIEEFYPYIIKK